MKRVKLISEVTENFKCATQLIDTEEKKAKEVFSEQQLDLIEEIWSYSYDFKETSNEELKDWNDQLEEMVNLL